MARATPPQPRGFPLYTTGPQGITNKPPDYQYGPGDPPPGFVTATTSATEWVWYWASAKVYNDPKDPRRPPFFGGLDWGFQLGEGEGIRGPATIFDFIYYLPGEELGVRIQTDRYHESAGPAQKAIDRNIRQNLSRWMTIRDVYEQDFIGDPSGEAACRLVVQTLGGRDRINPSASGTYRRVRPGSIR